MSSMARALTGENLTFDLQTQIAELRGEDGYARSGRVGRTLIKAGPFRLTLTVVADGIDIGTHHAVAPMTLQPIEGGLRYTVDGAPFEVSRGELLFFGQGHARDIRAQGDTALLLTIATDGEDRT